EYHFRYQPSTYHKVQSKQSTYQTRNYFFFFSSRRRHTRWPRDWSSDVCSSDLLATGHPAVALWPPGHSRAAQDAETPGRSRGFRSEERRVGKECRSRWLSDH